MVAGLDKALFTIASYNAGPGRIRSLRQEAEKRGLDPTNASIMWNRWYLFLG